MENKDLKKIVTGFELNWGPYKKSPDIYCFTPEGVFIGRIWHIFNKKGVGPNQEQLEMIRSKPYVAQLKGHYLFVVLDQYCGNDNMLEYNCQEVVEQMLYYYATNYLQLNKNYQYFKKTSIDNPYTPYERTRQKDQDPEED